MNSSTKQRMRSRFVTTLTLGLASLVTAVTFLASPAAAGGEPYPDKAEAPAPPRVGSFSPGATQNARTKLKGKGVYLCNEVVGIEGPSCSGGHPRADEEIIAIAKGEMGVQQLWVRAGDSRRGFPEAHRKALERLVPKAHAAGLAVVCWDLPSFYDIQADAFRLAEMSHYCDAVAADVESDGYQRGGYGFYAGPELETEKGRGWARAYSGWVRHFLANDNYPAIIITMQPQTHPRYPFREFTTGFNVFSPMMYRGGAKWFNEGDPAKGENDRNALNPFIEKGIATLRAAGVTADRHDILITGMTYAGGGINAHENQISHDMRESVRLGAIGFAGFVFEDLVTHPNWRAALKDTDV